MAFKPFGAWGHSFRTEKDFWNHVYFRYKSAGNMHRHPLDFKSELDFLLNELEASAKRKFRDYYPYIAKTDFPYVWNKEMEKFKPVLDGLRIKLDAHLKRKTDRKLRPVKSVPSENAARAKPAVSAVVPSARSKPDVPDRVKQELRRGLDFSKPANLRLIKRLRRK